MPDAAAPFPGPVAAPFADRQHHGPPGRADGLGPRRERRARVETGRVAPVDLHEVHVPGREASRVDELAPAAAGVALTGAVAGARIKPEAKIAFVKIRGECAHVGKAPEVRLEIAVVSAKAALPPVVGDDVPVAGAADGGPDGR